MISFSDELSVEEVARIRAYVIRRAHESLRVDAARAPASR